MTPNTLPFCASLGSDLGFRLRNSLRNQSELKKGDFPAAFAMAFFWAPSFSILSTVSLSQVPESWRQKYGNIPISHRHLTSSNPAPLKLPNRQLGKIWGQKTWLQMERQGHPSSATRLPCQGCSGRSGNTRHHRTAPGSATCIPPEGQPSSLLYNYSNKRPLA